MNAPSHSPDDLRARWAEFRLRHPKIRIREAAATLGVSEAELVATGCGTTVTRLAAGELTGGWGAVLEQILSLGRVMALTRNEHAVHERKGEYRGVELYGSMGSVLGPDIDLRVFFSQWLVGFAVVEESEQGPRESLQFFARDGSAIHKIYLQPESDREAFADLVARFKAADQSASQVVEPAAPKPVDPADETVDLSALHAGWRGLQDTHEFFGLLRKFKLGRQQALRLAEPEFARALEAGSAEELLKRAAAGQLPIMVFVGNPGIIQIHTGPVQRIAPFGEWINVLDADFNLHLRQTAIGSAWAVRKPTKEGFVTSVELFDQSGEFVIQFFGRRKPGESELEGWRELVAGLPGRMD